MPVLPSYKKLDNRFAEQVNDWFLYEGNTGI